MEQGQKALSLLAGKAYELVFSATRRTGVDDESAYFGDARRLAQKHGMNTVINLDIVELEHSDIAATKATIFEWPTLEKLQQFRAEKKWKQATTDHSEVFCDLSTLNFSVAESAEISFTPDGMYEFALFWKNRHNADLMDEYFKRMRPLIQQAAPRSLVAAHVIEMEDVHALKPHGFNFLQWTGGRAARDAIFSSEEFKENGYMRALALDRMMTIMVAPR